jgi:hypothetical protein
LADVWWYIAAKLVSAGWEAVMPEWEAGISQFPTVNWVDADKRYGGVDLIFGTRIEGQGSSLRIRLSRLQWENLKFLIDGPDNKVQSA